MNWEIDGNKSIRKIIILSTPATTPPIQGNRGQNSLVSLLELIVFGAGIFTRSHKLSIDIAIWFLSTAVAPASLHSNKLCKTILLPNLALQSHNPSSRTSESGPKNSFPRYIFGDPCGKQTWTWSTSGLHRSPSHVQGSHRHYGLIWFFDFYYGVPL